MSEGNARPAAPGPVSDMEAELRKVVEHRRNEARQQATRIGAIPAGGRFPDDMKSIGGVGVRLGEGSPLPTGKLIAERLTRVIDRLRDTEARSGSIATTLAGPSTPFRAITVNGEQPPAASLFVIYERALDEIDRIIDNIEHEQARVRDIIT